MRSLLLALLVSTPAAAQLSTSLTATGDVQLSLDVQCELACSADIDWRHSALDAGGELFTHADFDGGHFEFEAAPPQRGTALTFIASTNCSCGEELSLSAAPMPIAPRLELQENGGVLTVFGFPHGNETIEVAYSGAGLDGGLTITRAGADFTGGTTAVVLHPSESGELNVTAILKPWAVSSSAKTDVHAELPPSHEQPKGCSTTPGVLFALLALVSTRTRRSR